MVRFRLLLSAKTQEVEKERMKFKNGLAKLLSTEEMVAIMQEELTDLKPVLIQKTAETDAMMVQIEIDKKSAEVGHNHI